MKNARRNLVLAAVAATSLALAPSARADMRIHVSLPLPPLPHVVVRHAPLPVPPAPVVYPYAARWNYPNRYRDDSWVWIDGRWVARPFPGAVWVSGCGGPHGYRVAGHWAHGYHAHGHCGHGYCR